MPDFAGNGLQAGAYRTILTHFSQRYPKIPKIEKSFQSSTCIAFDLMSINIQGESNLLPPAGLNTVDTSCDTSCVATQVLSPRLCCMFSSNGPEQSLMSGVYERHAHAPADLPQLPTHVPALALLCKDADEEIEDVE